MDFLTEGKEREINNATAPFFQHVKIYKYFYFTINNPLSSFCIPTWKKFAWWIFIFLSYILSDSLRLLNIFETPYNIAQKLKNHYLGFLWTFRNFVKKPKFLSTFDGKLKNKV